MSQENAGLLASIETIEFNPFRVSRMIWGSYRNSIDELILRSGNPRSHQGSVKDRILCVTLTKAICLLSKMMANTDTPHGRTYKDLLDNEIQLSRDNSKDFKYVEEDMGLGSVVGITGYLRAFAVFNEFIDSAVSLMEFKGTTVN